jgi:enoyl-CoA hydratase
MVPHIAGLTVPAIARRALRILDDVILSIRDMHQPVIAAVNGAAIGGGLCLATACDIRIASSNAYFRAAGINNGLTSAELGLSYLLPRAIGSSRAFDIMLSGRDVDAAEADRIGLVSQVVEPEALLETCCAYAERIIGYSHIGVELTKQLLWASLDAGGLHAHMNHEGQAQLYVRLTTENFEESVRARAEGRDPIFLDHREYGHKLEPK